MPRSWQYARPTEPGRYRARHPLFSPREMVVGHISNLPDLCVWPEGDPDQWIPLAETDLRTEWKKVD